MIKNLSKKEEPSIDRKTIIKKYDITLNGEKTGEVKEGEAGYPCFAHCLLRKEND